MMKEKYLAIVIMVLLFVLSIAPSLAVKKDGINGATVVDPEPIDGYGRVVVKEEAFRMKPDENSFARLNLQKGGSFHL